MADGSINAKVRVVPDPQQAAQAGQEAGAAYNKGFNSTLASPPSAQLIARMSGIRSGLPGDSQTRMNREADEAKRMDALASEKRAFLKNISFMAAPLLNPTSFWSQMFGARQIFTALSGGEGQRILAKVSPNLATPGGTIAATAGLQAALTMIGLTFLTLDRILKQVAKTYETARQQYAHALMSGGLPLQTSIQRSSLASILGVAEKDVYMFGNAVKYLNPKVEYANSVMAKNAANLASVSWGFKVLATDLGALFSSIANIGAPAIRRFQDVFERMINTTTGFVEKHKQGLSNAGKAELFNLFPKLTIFGALLNKIGIDAGAAPGISAFAKQLPASHLERMGLVVGGFGIQDYSRQTAHNTKRMVSLLEMLVKPGATTAVASSHPAL